MPSTLLLSMTWPFFFRPVMKDRVEWGSQPTSVDISSSVAPPSQESRSITCWFLVFGANFSAGAVGLAAGVFVMPVNDARAWQRIRFLVMRQQPVQQGATPVAGRRMHHQTGRLVDDTQVRIFEHD